MKPAHRLSAPPQRQSLWLVFAALIAWSPASANTNLLLPEAPCPCRLSLTFALADADTTPRAPNAVGPRLKSPGAATRYSILGTILPIPTIVLAYPGLLFGPSFGYFYAGKPGRAWTGIGIRTLATGGAISSFAICGWDCGRGDEAYNIAWAVFLVSSGVFVGSVIYDWATVGPAVRRQNAALKSAQWRIEPTYSAPTGALGLRLSLRF
ncbi:MAG: hypothetical protein AB1752_12145 [Candidatus Zixiibacteriota bacterium]